VRFFSRWPRWVLVGLGAAAIASAALVAAGASVYWQFVPFVLVAIVLLVEIPRRQVARLDGSAAQKERFESENEARRTVVQLLSGLGIVATVAITLYQTNQSRQASERTLDLTAEGQVTERLSRTVEQLSHSGRQSLTARIGGIYTLEKMGRNRQVDPQVVGDILSAYVQAEAPAPGAPPISESTDEVLACSNGVQKRPSPDIQVALRALSALRARGPLHVDLSRTDLRGVSLRNGHLRDAEMTAAVLVDADLTGADLTNADLTGADFDGACLADVGFRDASMQDASLDGAMLENARLDGSCVLGASFQAARQLTAAQLGSACRDGTGSACRRGGCGT
jgi:hypothetical protein